MVFGSTLIDRHWLSGEGCEVQTRRFVDYLNSPSLHLTRTLFFCICSFFFFLHTATTPWRRFTFAAIDVVLLLVTHFFSDLNERRKKVRTREKKSGRPTTLATTTETGQGVHRATHRHRQFAPRLHVPTTHSARDSPASSSTRGGHILSSLSINREDPIAT